MKSPFENDEILAFRQSLVNFIEEEIAPHADAWDEAGEFPREQFDRRRHRPGAPGRQRGV